MSLAIKLLPTLLALANTSRGPDPTTQQGTFTGVEKDHVPQLDHYQHVCCNGKPHTSISVATWHSTTAPPTQQTQWQMITCDCRTSLAHICCATSTLTIHSSSHGTMKPEARGAFKLALISAQEAVTDSVAAKTAQEDKTQCWEVWHTFCKHFHIDPCL